MMESSLMVMEAFEGHEDKFTYDIVGHSGEEPAIPFVVGTSKRGQGRVGPGSRGEPRNEKERLEVLREIHAHAQVRNRVGIVQIIQGDTSGWLKPPVIFVLTGLVADGPLLYVASSYCPGRI